MDRSHRPHTLQTTLTPLQEDVVVALRTTLLLPLGDLLHGHPRVCLPGCIADVLHQTRFPTFAALTETLLKDEQIDNQHIPQRALGHSPPVQALKKWQKAKPELFHKRVDNHTGLDR